MRVEIVMGQLGHGREEKEGNGKEEKGGHTLPALFPDGFRDVGVQRPRTLPTGFDKHRDRWFRRRNALE